MLFYLCTISRNILCNIKHKIALNIAQYCLILYLTLLTILLTYCSIYFNIVHIAQIARVFIKCILPILYKIAQYCTKLLNIAQACCYTSCYKLYILLILLKIAQNCSIYASISRSFLSEMPAAAAFLLAASMHAASMLPVPLTVLLLYEFAATIHLLSTTTLCAPQQRGQQRLH